MYVPICPTVIIRSVDTIIDESLFDKQNIYRVSFPDTITAIEFNAFNAANYIDLDITFDDGVIDDELLKSDTGMNRVGTIVNISVEDGITTIGESSFAGCKLLPIMLLPETVTKIGASAFYDCNSMASINIPYGVTKINDYTFYGCSSLEEVLLPADIDSIGNYAYYGCTALSKLVFNKSLKSIGDYAFYNGNMISQLDLPDELEKIGDYAFRGCIGINTVIVPDSVNLLGEGAFYACTTLEEIYLSDLITELDDKIFYGCVALKKVMLSDKTDYIADYTFYGCDDCVLYCADNDYVAEYADFNFLQYCNTSGEFNLSVSAPVKVDYYQGEELDLAGMVVTADYDGDVVEIMSGYTVTGYDAEVVGTQTVTVEYKGQKAEFTVNVILRDCESITITPPTKVQYYTGQPLDLNGMVVTALFSGDKSVVIEEGYTVEGYDSTVAGEQTITVTYGEQTAQFVVTVIEKAIESISVKNSRLTYMQNEELDTQFITIVVKYNGGETSELPYDVNTMTVTGFDSSELCEKQTLILAYNGFEAAFDISIIKTVAPLTTTTTKIGTNYTRFYVDFEEDMYDATIIISVVDGNGKLEKVITAECDGDSRYTLTIPSLTKSKLAKVFVWRGLDTIKPLGVPEFIEIK